MSYSCNAGRDKKKCVMLGEPSRKKSAVLLNIVQTGGEGVIPMFKNFDVNYVTFKGPFGSIN